MAFGPEVLNQHLTRILPGDARQLLVAYSGGRDSQALLYAAAASRHLMSLPLKAVHVNHGLHPDAAAWVDHCRAICNTLDIPLVTVDLALQPRTGKSLEEMAREERYRALSRLIKPGDVLLTAHHQDDQAETVLLQLLRGAGPKGLSAMAEIGEFGPGYHARPLLSVSGDELQKYAAQACPGWQVDSSNADTRFDRNLLRNTVIPELKKRWPGLATTLSRSATHCAEAQQIVDRVAEQDLEHLLDQDGMSLQVDGLLRLPEARIHTALRHWIQQMGHPLPSLVRLRRIVEEVCCAAADRTPEVHWSGVELRRYRNRLYLVEFVENNGENSSRLSWDGRGVIEIPRMGIRVGCHEGPGGIRRQDWQEGELEIGFRLPGLRCRPIGRGGSVSLKKLFQELGIPPWQRQRVPLLFINGELAAIAGRVICEPFDGDQKAIGMHLSVEAL